MAKVSRLGHISLFAHDVRRLSSFYEKTLGLQMTESANQVDTAYLAIDRQSGRHDLLIMNNPHHVHLSFCVDSIDDFRGIWEHVKAIGILTKGPYMQSDKTAFSFLDPEGNHVEIMCQNTQMKKER